MRIEVDGERAVDVGADPDRVHESLADRDGLFSLVSDLLHRTSTARRWVLAELRAGPVVISPAVDVELARVDDVVAVRGTPVDGHTPSELGIDLEVVDGRTDGSRITARWQVAVDVPGPQVLASTVRPAVRAGARRTVERVAARMRERFGDP